MIDFRKLVLEYIELTEATAGPVDTFFNFYEDNAKFTNLRQYLDKQFKITYWPTRAEWATTLQVSHSRTTVEGLVKFADAFPLADFIWYMYEQLQVPASNTNWDPVLGTIKWPWAPNIENLETQFISSNERANPVLGSNPVYGYVTSSVRGAEILRMLIKKLSENLIGKLVIENPVFQPLGIKQVLYQILALRKQSMSFTFSKTPPSDIPFIDKIIKNPAAAAINAIPPELKQTYDRVTGEQLINIANVIHEFYNSEYKQTFKGSTTVDQTYFDWFILNKPLANIHGSVETFSFGFGTSSGSLNVSPSLSSLSNGGVGGYTWGNIRMMESNPPQAAALVSTIQSFANYLKEGEPRNWKGVSGGVSQIAKGLSFGAPELKI